jgi:hypothetical protein
MSATIKGIQPLKFGTTTITGYIVEDYGGDVKTDELVIDNEAGDIVTQITGFGIKTEVSLSVIPLAATTGPAIDTVLTYDSKAIRVLSCAIKQVRKDVEKWVIKGTLYPNVSVT